jgi:hypothetical protein
MRLSVRAVASLALSGAMLTPLITRNDASARTTVSPKPQSVKFHPAQVNATPENTVVPTSTVAPTSTPLPSPTLTPAPTSPPTSSAPAASTLLAKARTALKSANTDHFKLQETLALLNILSGKVIEQGDTSVRPSEIQAHVTGSVSSGGKPQKLDERHVQIGKNAWVKSAKTHGVWKSEKATSPTAGGSLQNPIDIVKGSGVKITGLTTTGAETYAHVAVWHVHGKVTVQLDQATSATGTVDYLIAKSGHLPHRILAYVNDPKDGVLLDLRLTLSGFGKKVSIATPKVGSALR